MNLEKADYEIYQEDTMCFLTSVPSKFFELIKNYITYSGKRTFTIMGTELSYRKGEIYSLEFDFPFLVLTKLCSKLYNIIELRTFEEIQNDYRELDDSITTKQLSELVGLSKYNIRKLAHSGVLEKLDSSSSTNFVFDKQQAIKKIYVRDESYQRYRNFFQNLFKKSYNTNSVETIFTILEVDGMSDGHWNPSEEVFRFFNDFNDLLSKFEHSKKFPLRQYRLALIMYCHILESNFHTKLIMNLLRIVDKNQYVLDPFSHSKNKPPALKWKYDELCQYSQRLEEAELSSFIKEFYLDEIRNSFYHSDYCFTEKYFRYRTNLGIEGLRKYKANYPLKDMPIQELFAIISRCFAFFEALFHTKQNYKHNLAQIRKFHKLQGYEVLELISKDDLLIGFSMHFSNEAKATFIREPETVIANNILFETDGSVNFMVGNLDKLCNEWKVNGVKYTEKA